MKRFEKITLGCAGVLLLGCLATGTVFLLSDSGSAFLGRNSDLVAKGRALSALDREFPFQEPRGGAIPETRVEAFLAVACATKKPGDEAAAWVKANGRTVVFGQTVFPEEGAGLMGAYLDALSPALKQQQMSPAEYLWMGQRLFLVSEGPPSEIRLAELQKTLETLKEEARSEEEESRSHRRQRRRLDREIEALTAAVGQWGKAEDADWELYRRHADRLGACAPSGREMRLLGEYYTPPPGTTLRFYGEPLGHAENDSGEPPGPEPPSPPEPPVPDSPAPTPSNGTP